MTARAFSANFGKVVVLINDAYFMVEPAEPVIVSANSQLRTASGGAHEVTRIAGPQYAAACSELLHGHPDGPAQGSAWLTGSPGEKFALTAGRRQVIQAITLRYINGEPIRATPEIVYHAARYAFAVAEEAGNPEHRYVSLGNPSWLRHSKTGGNGSRPAQGGC